MASEIVLNVDGLLLNWLKQVGDTVKKGDLIAELEADKATVEVESPVDGTVLSLVGEIGAELTTGTVIGSVGEAGSAPAEASDKALAATKGKGDAEAAEPDAELKAESAASEEKATVKSAESSVADDGRVKASPLARKIAEDKGINLTQVPGSGPNGRIVKADVEAFKPGAAAPATASQAVVPQSEGIPLIRLRPLPAQTEGMELIDVTRMRRTIAAGTTESAQQIPHFIVTTEMDLQPLMDLRGQINAQVGEGGVKVSVNDMIVKAVALSLRQYPNLNTHYYGDKMVRYSNINIGIAVAPPNGGVIYIVAKDADKVGLGTLAKTNKEMIERARELKLKPEDTKGATFSTSNLGPFEVESFSAIINPPESAVVAIGSGRKVPVVKADGTIGVGLRIKMTISIDHRVSDGAEGAQFMLNLKSLIENPMRLLL
jgi:pyruvate dehydrogenase E2 component (dihydrolipoamide acetyltransferase)